MARLLTAGAETLSAIGEDKTMEGGITSVVVGANGVVSVDSATVHAGAKSFKVDSGASGNGGGYLQYSFTPALATIYYARAWFYAAAFPSSAYIVLENDLGVAGSANIRLTSTGTMEVRDSTVVLGTSSAVSLNTWFSLELAVQHNSTASTSYVEGRLNGVSFGSSSTVNRTTVAAPALVRYGPQGGSGNNIVTYVDDIAFNDNAGANQNTWAGLSKQVLLLPTGDNAIGTGWTLGSGGTTVLWDAVNNVPPVGVADAGTTGQIRNASANANVNYDATMNTYSEAGITVVDTVNLVDPMVWTAAPVTTSSKQGTVGVASNPAIANIALAAGGTAGAFWSGTTGGTYATGWKLSHGTLTYAPSVTVSTAPVMRVTQVTSSTRIAMVCFMGIYVDYTPGTAGTNLPKQFNPVPVIPRGRSM